VPNAAEAGLRREIVEIARCMSLEGLSPVRSGNVSARFSDGMLITPTAMAYSVMTADDVVFIDAEGAPQRGGRAPSSEWHFHLAIYGAKAEARAVVHCHSTSATALACARKSIPAFHYMVAVAGGQDIPLAPYATFGTPELAQAVVATLKDRRACLLANHGQIAFGETLEATLDLAREVEALAAQYIAVLQLGAVHILDDEEMGIVLAKFETYGQQLVLPKPQRPARAKVRPS